MVTFKKYTFRKYSENFPLLFRKEKNKLRKILTKDARIEHGGSSAIKGLGGKGIIDIFISVKKKDIKKNRNNLQKAGYVFKPSGGSKEREYFEREYLYRGNARRVHLHLTFHNSFEMRRAVAFVKYLQSHPDKVKEYAKIKKDAVKYAKGEGKKYREYKKKFLEKLGEEALKEFG